MRHKLLALFGGIAITGPAQAYSIFDIKETGTQINFYGSVRLKYEHTYSKTQNYATGRETGGHESQAVSNNSSRFGFKIHQNLGNDFYMVGRAEWRFRSTSRHQHNFGELYARKLYAGFGHKKYGELVYGNMTTITDEVKQTDLARTYSLSDGLLEHAARRVVQYGYKNKGFRNGDKLRFGVYYGGASKRGNTGLDLDHRRKNIWGAGAIYTYKIDDDRKLNIAAGITREIFANTDESSFTQTAYAFGTAYMFGPTTVGLDLEQQVTANQDTDGDRRRKYEIRTVLHHYITPSWAAYTQLAYKTDRRELMSGKDTKEIKHQFMLGTEYDIRKYEAFTVKTFLEWQATRTKTKTNGIYTSKQHDYKTVIGLRFYW